jgi:hypothetical protein
MASRIPFGIQDRTSGESTMDKLSVEDWIAIGDHIGDFCWKVASGDGDAVLLEA